MYNYFCETALNCINAVVFTWLKNQIAEIGKIIVSSFKIDNLLAVQIIAFFPFTYLVFANFLKPFVDEALKSKIYFHKKIIFLHILKFFSSLSSRQLNNLGFPLDS